MCDCLDPLTKIQIGFKFYFLEVYFVSTMVMAASVFLPVFSILVSLTYLVLCVCVCICDVKNGKNGF